MKHTPVTGSPLPIPARKFDRVAVIGAGAWGTALAATLARAGVETRLWGRDQGVVDGINDHHTNIKYLADAPLPTTLVATTDMATALNGAQAALIVVPSRSIRSISKAMAACVPAGIPIAVCAKGIEAKTGLLMTQVAEEELPGHPVGCVSGPTFARETALGHPTAATVAFPFAYADRLKPADSPAAQLAVSLTTESFRAYVSDDLVGVEIGGALKNVLALAVGIARGLQLGASAEAALIARGFAELGRVANAQGARSDTLAGLSGLGDLVLSCSSPQSRNFSYGMALATGEDLTNRPLAEGVHTAEMALKMAQQHGVDTPIIAAIVQVLAGEVTPLQAVQLLLQRPLKGEV